MAPLGDYDFVEKTKEGGGGAMNAPLDKRKHLVVATDDWMPTQPGDDECV